MSSVEQTQTVDRIKHVTSSVRNANLSVVLASVLRMLHVRVLTINQSVHVILAQEEVDSYHASDVRESFWDIILQKLIISHFSNCTN